MNWRAFLIGAVMLTAGFLASDQPPLKIKRGAPENISAADGPRMFRAYCAVCHGPEGLGNGPAAAALKKQPADLTQLSRKNNGKFPVYRVANVIQGAGETAAHGSREMPIWGTVFRTLGRDTVKLRVDNLTSYIDSIQRQ